MKMKVAQILPKMNVGGVERGVMDLVRFFKTDPRISCFVISGGGRLVSELKAEGITHHTLGVYQKSLGSLANVGRLRDILAAEGADIAHARSRVPAWLAFLATRNSPVNFLTTAHGMYKNRLASEVMGWGKFVICPSQAVAAYMRRVYGVPQEKIVVINRWVDLARFQFSEYSRRLDCRTIVTMGRLSPSKGYEYIIEAFKELVRFDDRLRLKIVGNPDPAKLYYFRYLKGLVAKYGLGRNVEFEGFRQDVENVLADTRMLVAASVSDESFGRVVIEAQACGVPVIATDVAGFREIIDHNETGIKVPPADSRAIADSILRLLDDHVSASSMVSAARRKVEENYSLEKCLKETAQLYERVVNEQRILVIKISSLGDIILCLPSLKAIKERYPAARVSVLTLRKYAAIFYGCPWIDEVISLGSGYKSFFEIWDLGNALRRRAFDYIIDLQNSRVSHVLSALSLARYSVGFSLRWGKLLSLRAVYRKDQGPLESQGEVLKLAGVELRDKKLVFWDAGFAGQFDLPDTLLVGINVSASARWESKNWPFDAMRRLIELLDKEYPSSRVVLLGDVQTLSLADSLQATSAGRLINLCGRTSLSDLPRVLKRLKVLVTPDTATLHLAQACGVPVIALFGPTDPARHCVKSDNLRIINKKIECSYCYKPNCRLKANLNRCMKEIKAEEVFEAIKHVITNDKYPNDK